MWPFTGSDMFEEIRSFVTDLIYNRPQRSQYISVDALSDSLLFEDQAMVTKILAKATFQYTCLSNFYTTIISRYYQLWHFTHIQEE